MKKVTKKLWWRRWRSGAYCVGTVFFDRCAALIEQYQQEARDRGVTFGFGYFDGIDTFKMRRGEAQYLPPSAVDVLARVAQELHVVRFWGWSMYQALTDSLIANEEWHSDVPRVDIDGRSNEFGVAKRREARSVRTPFAQRTWLKWGGEKRTLFAGFVRNQQENYLD